jgi:hypothetical protein
MDSDSPTTDRRNAVACDVGDGRMTAPPEGLTWTCPGRGEAGTDQRPPAPRAIVGLHWDRPIKITEGCVDRIAAWPAGIEPATCRFSVGSDCGTRSFILVRPPRKLSQQASLSQWMSLMASGAGLATQPCHGQPTPNVAANRVLTRTSSGTAAPRGYLKPTEISHARLSPTPKEDDGWWRYRQAVGTKAERRAAREHVTAYHEALTESPPGLGQKVRLPIDDTRAS